MASRSSDRKYRIWRVKIIRRDKCCILCGSKKRKSAHHLNSWSYFPDERYDLDNGVCLCANCHITFHTDFKRSYRQKCTKYDFRNYIALIHYHRYIYHNNPFILKTENIF